MRRRLGSGWATVLVIALTGCGGSTPSASSTPRSGREIALTAGCTSCHGSSFGGGVGPSWVGLYGSSVELTDGSTVTADADYLSRSIREPSVQRVAGFTSAMPPNGLTDEEIHAVVEFIETLSSK